MSSNAAIQPLAGAPDRCRPNHSGNDRVDGCDEERAYHDERARAEFLLADRTDSPSIAERHRDLARLHIARRATAVTVTRIPRAAPGAAAPIFRTDKEA